MNSTIVLKPLPQITCNCLNLRYLRFKISPEGLNIITSVIKPFIVNKPVGKI